MAEIKPQRTYEVDILSDQAPQIVPVQGRAGNRIGEANPNSFENLKKTKKREIVVRIINCVKTI